MEVLKNLVDIIVHVDKHLLDLCTQYGAWVYAILFLIVFCETGLVVTPFLPGDSLLFAVGSLAAIQALRIEHAIPLLICAALTGDNVNYWIGRTAGPKVFQKEHSLLFSKEYLERTRRFYEKHGRKAIVIARFLPIIRTFAPFVAGVGRMVYVRFLLFSVLGAILWVVLFVVAGFYFGNDPFVKNNFSLVILALLLIPGIPALVEFIKIRLKRTAKPSASK